MGKESLADVLFGPARRWWKRRSLRWAVDVVSEHALGHCWHTQSYKNLFRSAEQMGFHITPNHFYSPIPDTRDIAAGDLSERESEMVGVDMNVEHQLDLLSNAFPVFGQEFSAFPQGPDLNFAPYEFHFNNGQFDGVDALVLYSMVRHFNPRLIVEVGSGWSTRVSASAALKNGNTELIAIEPHPQSVLVAGFPGLTSLMEKRIEDVDLSLFSRLEDGDILFIDSSHVVRTGGDVNYLYLEVLPRLKKGVIVHIHDIFLPREYPQWWITDRLLFWNEQYLLHAFLVFNSHFRVEFASNYMLTNYQEEVRAVFPECPFYDAGSSFWIRKTR